MNFRTLCKISRIEGVNPSNVMQRLKRVNILNVMQRLEDMYKIRLNEFYNIMQGLKENSFDVL